jgi:hypothetical protein
LLSQFEWIISTCYPKDWECNSVVECLPSICKVLGLIPTSQEKQKRKKITIINSGFWGIELLIQLFFFPPSVLRFELRAFTLSHTTSPIFCDKVFWDRVSGTVCLGWLQIVILLISASWVVRITGVSHPCRQCNFLSWHKTIRLFRKKTEIGSPVSFLAHCPLRIWFRHQRNTKQKQSLEELKKGHN